MVILLVLSILVVQLLLEYHPEARYETYSQEHLCTFDKAGYAPIHYAAGAGSPEELHTEKGQKWINEIAMKQLFHHGADMKAVDPKNRTLLNYGSAGCSIVSKQEASVLAEGEEPVYMPPNQMPLGRMLRVGESFVTCTCVHNVLN